MYQEVNIHSGANNEEDDDDCDALVDRLMMDDMDEKNTVNSYMSMGVGQS